MTKAGAGAPLAGLRVVEVSLGLSAVGAGLASSLPGALLRDLGADVLRIQGTARSTLDAGVEFSSVWDRGKELVEVDLADPPQVATTLRSHLNDADVAFASGHERLLEANGSGYLELARANPGLVWSRIRPSWTAAGSIPDLELLVQARMGLLGQIRGRRPGPTFGDLTVASAGAALCATVGALALLYERQATGAGGWVETSLSDGLLALLPMIIGRVEHPSGATELLWRQQGPSESLAYRCRDGDFIQLWFGAKGAYEAFLEHMGDEPSEAGYNADLAGGAMAKRSARWAERFAAHDRSWWVEDLAGQAFRCEPVWRPGEALLDGHVAQIGLSAEHPVPGRGSVTSLGPVARVVPVAREAGADPGEAHPGSRLLEGVRVLDLSAYLAGPITPLILAELGADVIKVEPVSGDVHRWMEPMFAAGQRGKRAIGLDMKAPEAAQILGGLFGWSDVVHHNSRVGLAERLGYDEAAVRRANPEVVYSFASGFGTEGPRALLPANDHLMQALSGIEAAQGSPGEPPTFLVWGAVDVTSGWLSAISVLAGLFARRRSGAGQSVSTSLLGAALMLKSGAFISGGEVISGPVLDADQTGYGAAYRLYEASDGAWVALGVDDQGAWERLRSAVDAPGLPIAPPPLRLIAGERQDAEVLLEAVFRTRPAAAWVAALASADVPAELAAEPDRAGFIARVLDDPVSRQLGRVVSLRFGDRGLLEQPGFPMRLGPKPRPAAPVAIPRLGEHGAEILSALGFDAEARARLVASGAVAPSPS
jgi:crotonobetainyl-CoA:carnitine CoA-transferase CaiB-like acyl-CoA transferase